MKIKDDWTTEDLLALFYLPRVNSAAIFRIVNGYTSWDHVLNSVLPPQLQPFVNQLSSDGSLLSRAQEEARRQYEYCRKLDVAVVSRWHSHYPALLNEIGLPPALLFVQGSLQQSDSAVISIVGKRDCTEYGRKVANDFAAYMAEKDFIVCSGMARGIDTSSHYGALKAGGATYAVIASGIDCLTPATARDLQKDIVANGGAIISEYPCGEKAKVAYFPQRNRLISGIAKATIVVESDLKGGGLITAKFAWEQNREVYAVPGRINSKESAGCNNLILQQKAKPALSAHQVLDDLGYIAGSDDQMSLFFDAKPPSASLTDDESKIMDLLAGDPLHVDEIALRLGMPISALLVNLLSLEMNSFVKPLPGNHYTRL